LGEATSRRRWSNATVAAPQNLTVKIVPNDKGNPPGKLADAELHFTDGVLAGLNRVWFTTFQLKRMRKLVESFELAPPRLAERLEALFDPDANAAVAELERLVGETRELVRERFPDLELPLARELGTRHAPFAGSER